MGFSLADFQPKDISVFFSSYSKTCFTTISIAEHEITERWLFWATQSSEAVMDFEAKPIHQPEILPLGNECHTSPSSYRLPLLSISGTGQQCRLLSYQRDFWRCSATSESLVAVVLHSWQHLLHWSWPISQVGPEEPTANFLQSFLHLKISYCRVILKPLLTSCLPGLLDVSIIRWLNVYYDSLQHNILPSRTRSSRHIVPRRCQPRLYLVHQLSQFKITYFAQWINPI